MKPKIYLIAVMDAKGGIGLKGKLPWHLPGDLKFFQKTTIHTDDIQRRNMVVMGRVTWESIPEKHRPFMGRRNVVVTRNKDYTADEGVVVVHSFESAMKAVDERVNDVFIIGGGKLFEQGFRKLKIDGIYLTRIKKTFECDTKFPKIPPAFKPIKIGEGADKGVEYEFFFYKKQKTNPKLKAKSRTKGRSRSPKKAGRAPKQKR